MSVTAVPVRLTERLQVRNGGLLHPGEVAWLDPADAAALIARGGAITAALGSPPEDKMVGSPAKKERSKTK